MSAISPKGEIENSISGFKEKLYVKQVECGVQLVLDALKLLSPDSENFQGKKCFSELRKLYLAKVTYSNLKGQFETLKETSLVRDILQNKELIKREKALRFYHHPSKLEALINALTAEAVLKLSPW